MALCEYCQGGNRTTCLAQDKWDENERLLNIHARLITEDWEGIVRDPELESVKASLDETLEELARQRAEGAVNFQRDADQLGCNNLVILAFAK